MSPACWVSAGVVAAILLWLLRGWVRTRRAVAARRRRMYGKVTINLE